MTRKITACRQIVAGFAVVFASAISDTQAQQPGYTNDTQAQQPGYTNAVPVPPVAPARGPPIVRVEDCGKTAVFVCGTSGQWLGGPPRRMRVRPGHHVRHTSDQPTSDLQWLWNDP